MQFNMLHHSRRWDRSLQWLCQPLPLAYLTALVLLAFFTVMLAACTGQTSPGGQPPPSAHASPGVATETRINSLDQTPAVHMGVNTFVQSTITLPKGSKLRLIDDGQYLHVMFNGMWENNKAHMATEPGAPTVQRLYVNGNSVEIGPFSTAGTFHLYCVIHPGMNLTVVVE
jgi:plastocyanin